MGQEQAWLARKTARAQSKKCEDSEVGRGQIMWNHLYHGQEWGIAGFILSVLRKHGKALVEERYDQV